MELEELLEKRKKLRHRLVALIGQPVLEFSRETKVGISDISVNMEEVTNMGDPHTQYIVGSVDVTLDL